MMFWVDIYFYIFICNCIYFLFLFSYAIVIASCMSAQVTDLSAMK